MKNACELDELLGRGCERAKKWVRGKGGVRGGGDDVIVVMVVVVVMKAAA